jgi:TPR repeat protein
MVSRYILSYDGPPGPDSPSDPVTKTKAAESLIALAESKFKAAYFWAGDCYYNGNGIEKDLALAFNWFQRADLECKDPDAKLRIGKMYKDGSGVEKDVAKAVQIFEALVDTKHQTVAQQTLGQIYWEGSKDVERNIDISKYWYTLAVKDSSADAEYMLGLISMELGEEEEALTWYEKAIDRGNVAAMREFALLYQHGEGSIEQDLSKTSFWLQRAVTEGDSEAMVYLGLAYEHGMGTVIFRNRDKAMQLYQDAAAAGNSNAMFLAAQMFHASENYAQALELFEQAANHGKMTARVMIARYSLNGLGGSKEDPVSGFKVGGTAVLLLLIYVLFEHY